MKQNLKLSLLWKKIDVLLYIFNLVNFINGHCFGCCKIFERGNIIDEHTIVDTTVKTLSGTWVSEGCETRPGPEYVLRHYTFQENGQTKLIQHHYWDASCSFPKFTIISKGRLKTRRDAFLHHDALSGYLKTINVTITAHDFKAINELKAFNVSCSCGGKSRDTWRPLEEYLVYSSTESQGPNCIPERTLYQDDDYYSKPRIHLHVYKNIKCLGALKWTFDEIQLIKVQLRPNNYLVKEVKEMRWELLLGDLPSRPSIRDGYTPTAFQIPLVKLSKGEAYLYKGDKFFVRYSCHICSRILTNEKVPPSLMAKPRLPVFINGEWISGRCEIRPMGLYLIRKFSFQDDMWVGEHKFFRDPFCSVPRFFVTARGTFEIEEESGVVKEAHNVRFEINGASLIILEQSMTQSIYPETCGKHEWKVAHPQELGPTNGCYQLGITIPSTQFDIAKLEMDYQGSWLLFLGQADTENVRPGPFTRPTAFQLPMIKCSDEDDFIVSREITHNSAKKKYCYLCWMCLPLLLIWTFH